MGRMSRREVYSTDNNLQTNKAKASVARKSGKWATRSLNTASLRGL